MPPTTSSAGRMGLPGHAVLDLRSRCDSDDLPRLDAIRYVGTPSRRVVDIDLRFGLQTTRQTYLRAGLIAPGLQAHDLFTRAHLQQRQQTHTDHGTTHRASMPHSDRAAILTPHTRVPIPRVTPTFAATSHSSLWSDLLYLPTLLIWGLGRAMWFPFEIVGQAAGAIIAVFFGRADAPFDENVVHDPRLVADRTTADEVEVHDDDAWISDTKSIDDAEWLDTADRAKAPVPYANPPICPISFAPLTEAVTTLCQHAFDESAMGRWLLQGHTDCPTCSADVRFDDLRQDDAVRQWAHDWLEATVEGTPAPDEAYVAWRAAALLHPEAHPPQCPITYEPFTDAVSTACQPVNHTFERAPLMAALRSYGDACPSCRQHVDRAQIYAKPALNDLARLWAEANEPESWPPENPSPLCKPDLFASFGIEMPESLRCAFSQTALRNPVRAPCEHVFEYDSVADIIRTEGCCPLDNVPMQTGQLAPCPDTMAAVVAWQLETIRAMPTEVWDAMYFAQILTAR